MTTPNSTKTGTMPSRDHQKGNGGRPANPSPLSSSSWDAGSDTPTDHSTTTRL